MAVAGSPFAGLLSLFLVATIFVILDQTNLSYCGHRYLPETKYDTEPEGSSARVERDLIDDGLSIVDGLVGRARQRRGRRGRDSEPPILLYTACPNESSKEPLSDFQKRVMFFHRPGDTLKTELRLEETVGPKNKRSWNTDYIDMMISDYEFDLSKPTLMYTHGYLQDTKENFIKIARQNYDKLQENRKKPSYNLLLFDWGGFAYGGYSDCVAETPRTAKLLAEFFEYLHTRHNYDLRKLHLISFSLSTHIAGQAARILAKTQRVGQITYLDPTGVCFHDIKSQKFGETYGARDDDAIFTVAKHYNKYGFGSYRDHVGRVNVQVNDGTRQRRAPANRNAITDIVHNLFPAHLYAVQHNVLLFKPEDECHEMAYECSSYENFLKGQCGSCGKDNATCLLMNPVGNLELGIDVTKISYKPDSQMFITTGDTQFCVYQYQVVVTLKKPPTPEVAKKFTSGQFAFEPVKGLQVQPINQRGRQFTQLIKATKRVTAFPSDIDIVKHEKLVDLIESVRIRYLAHYSADVRRKWSVRYCPDSNGKALTKCKDDFNPDTGDQTDLRLRSRPARANGRTASTGRN